MFTSELDINPRRQLDSFELLRFFSDEIKHEFNLLGQRMGWYITCQSFLLTAFAISLGGRFTGPPWFSYAIAVIGLATSALVYPGIIGAHETIDMYLHKKRDLFRTNDELRDLQIARDQLMVNTDSVHRKSLVFSQLMPVLMTFLWIAMALFLRFFPANQDDGIRSHARALFSLADT
jgi:hypothetical protein